MTPNNGPLVWLAYVSYPVTTAAYLERALRKECRVMTCGPKIGPEIIQAWHLQNMKLPVRDQDLPLPFAPDMEEVVSELRGRIPDPDLYLWVESVPGHLPTHLDAVKCPKACYLIDTHLNLDWHLQWAAQFDYVFLAQREYVAEFLKRGCRNVQWLPLGCDPEVHAGGGAEKRYDIGFAGSIFANTRRAELLQRLANKRFQLKAERCFWDEMARLFSQSRMVFNNAIRNDLNMRTFEAMSTGTLLFTDLALNSGQAELFVDGEDLAIYQDDRLIETARHYLIYEEKREQIARRGQLMVHQAHTYLHRCRELIQVCLRGQPGTPTAPEWRERSLAGVGPVERRRVLPPPSIPTGRSFIIPVLDASPKGKAEFEALLSDLQEIAGEVIVVFNSPEAAALFKSHPRIDIACSLNVNSGVPRAWNIGVHLSTQPTLFILNADLRVGRSAVEALERGLWTLPSAAVVGPQGGFIEVYAYEDIYYFDKGDAKTSICVDAVSGFFFAAKRELFARRILQFEDAFTPCCTEEWDLGLQVRQAGYRSYVIPTTDYHHKWGVSGHPERVIRYWKDSQAEWRHILARNRIIFWRKWLAASGQFSLPPWEANGPEAKRPVGPALLQSRVQAPSSGGS